MTPKKALIIGASRGIGLGLGLALQQRGWQIDATRRRPESGQTTSFNWLTLDINHEEQCQAFAAQLPAENYDAIVINAGVYGPAEQAVNQASNEQLLALFLTNTFSPVRLGERLIPALKKNTGVLAFMSSQLASLNENSSAELPLYSASKAALNVLTRALLPAAQANALTVLSLHPGWVQTDLGGEHAPLSVEQSATGLANVLEQSLSRGGHHFIDYAGNHLSW